MEKLENLHFNITKDEEEESTTIDLLIGDNKIGKAVINEYFIDTFIDYELESIKYSLNEYNDRKAFADFIDLINDKDINRVFELNFLKIDNNYRNNGFGTLLINKTIEHLKSIKNYTDILYLNSSGMGSDIDNNRLEKFYKKSGLKTFINQEQNTLMFQEDFSKLNIIDNKNKNLENNNINIRN